MVLHLAIDDLASSESAAPQSTDIGRHSDEGSFVPILLQKSEIARRQFSCCKKIRPTTADRCGPNHVTEVASEFIFRQ